MTDDDANEANTPAAEWTLRPWLLAGLLGLAGLLIHLVTQGRDDVPWQVAIAAFLFFGAIAAAFTLERDRWKEPAVFAVVVGLVMAGLAWRAAPADQYLPDEQYGFAAGVVATALALPLFQAGFLRTRLRTPYPEIYHQVWTDAISAAGALAFTGIAWIVLALMSELFRLLQIDILSDLMGEGWFGWTFSGLAAGAALGTIRNQLKVLTVMQTVVLLVASLLAVPLAAGLVIFLLATAVQGPQMLWDATRSATPLLLACAAGAFVLANAIARQDDETMTRSRAMRIADWTLAAVILPLAVFAAVSMGLRLDQHGLSPARLWGSVAIVVALACGAIYWLALIRGRRSGWAANIRASTFHLGLLVCALALVLALPIVNFSAISTRNQVARLQSGAVPVDEFDFAALRWDFGEPGRRALRRLAQSADTTIAELARATLELESRPYRLDGTPDTRDRRLANLQFRLEDPELRKEVERLVGFAPPHCTKPCFAIDIGTEPGGSAHLALVEGTYAAHITRDDAGNLQFDDYVEYLWQIDEGEIREGPPVGPDTKIEVRPYVGRRIYADGRPLGGPFD